MNPAEVHNRIEWQLISLTNNEGKGLHHSECKQVPTGQDGLIRSYGTQRAAIEQWCNPLPSEGIYLSMA